MVLKRVVGKLHYGFDIHHWGVGMTRWEDNGWMLTLGPLSIAWMD